MISQKAFEQAACILGVDLATIQAVAKVESGGQGMVTLNGSSVPIILYEPHIFWQQLEQRGINPARHTSGNGDILYRSWGSKPYPKYQIQRYKQLERATSINRDAGLSSCSWGKFQIMGFNWRKCSCVTLQQFINEMYKGEDAQLTLFTHYILNTGLADELQNKQWAAFALAYNGKSYAKNKYDIKLKNAYNSFKK